MNVVTRDPIYLDESDCKWLKTVDKDDVLTLVNTLDKELDENTLYNHLKNLEGADKLESLSIAGSSRLKNVEIIRAFPNLKALDVCGYSILSLDGLDWFKKGEYIRIDTEKNRKRNIERVADVPIQRMYLNQGQKADFDAISKCRFLKRLILYKSPSPEFNEWRDVPLEYLKLLQGRFVELNDMGNLSVLNTLMIGGCRKFESFLGCNSSVLSLTVVHCRLFNIASLKSLQKVENVIINDCAKEISLSDLPEHPSIRYLSLLSCKIIADANDIESKMPNIEVVSIPKMSDEQEQSLIKANPNTIITKKWINDVM